jgi:hypothetical protein
MIERSFVFNFTPLTLSHGIALVGTVPTEQNYSAYDETYTPDYEITPLSLFPWVSIIDKDGVLPAGNVNAQLANITWEAVTSEGATVITSSDDYEVVTSGESAGTLRVKHNINPDTTLTLRFSAQYVDTRTNQVFYINDSILLSCYSVAMQTPTLALSLAESNVYNPLRDDPTVKITATVYLGERGKTEAETEWMVSNDGKTFHAVGSDTLDYWATADGNTLTVDRQLMGTVAKVKCVAVKDDTTMERVVVLTRRIPEYSARIDGGTARVAGGQDSVAMSCCVSDKTGDIDDYERELLPLWYGGTTDAKGASSLSTYLGHGKEIEMPTSIMSQAYGARVGVEMADRGAWKALTDGDGRVMTDGDGKIIVFH